MEGRKRPIPSGIAEMFQQGDNMHTHTSAHANTQCRRANGNTKTFSPFKVELTFN